MARRSSRTSISAQAVPGVRFGLLPSLQGLAQARAIVRALEDRRRFHPLRSLRPPAAVQRSDRRLVETKPATRFGGLFSFAVPPRVAICVRRKERREVLFARRKMRKGAGAQRRRNKWSDVSCR